METNSAFKKMYPQKHAYELDQELGGGELSLSTRRGWEIDHQDREKLQMPEGMPRGGWLEVKLNHA